MLTVARPSLQDLAIPCMSMRALGDRTKNNAAGACVPYPYAYAYGDESPPGVVYDAARAGGRELSPARTTRVPRPRLRARAGKPASWPAISVLITADVAVHSGLINNYSAWALGY